MNVYLPNLRLPSEYQEVEYIQSSWDWDNTWQYINTLLSIQNWQSLKVEIDFQYLNNTTAERDIFAYYVDSTNDYILWFKWWFFWILNSSTNWTLTTTRTPNTYSTNTRYKVIAEWTTKNSSKSPFLFASNWGNDNLWDWDISAKLYYCKVRQNNVLVRDFIPCYRKSDSVIWLYDLVNNQFYTNSWTGTFSKWSDVTMAELKNAYIGEYIEETYTIDSFSDSSWWTTKTVNWYKSWYKIKKIVIEWSCTLNSSWTIYPWIQSNDATESYTIFKFWGTSSSNMKYSYRYGTASEINTGINATKSNMYTYKITLTADTWVLVLNWNTYSWQCDSTMENIINHQNFDCRVWLSYGTANNTIFTVTYEQA